MTSSVASSHLHRKLPGVGHGKKWGARVPNDGVAGNARRRDRCHRASIEKWLVSEPYSLPAIMVKVLLRLEPTKVNAAIAATAINAAIKAYSIAVTPDSSLNIFKRSVRNRILLGF
jgi:hypothetical protein